MKTKKIILIAVAVAVVVGGGIWFFTGSPAKHKVMYASATVSKGDISNSVTATGTIEPVIEVEVGTQVSGIIDKIYVDYNSVVTKGQLIAEMDRVTLQSELASQQATYDGAKAEFEYQKKNYERSKGLHDKSLISDTDYEQALYNYQKAKSAFDSSKASLAKAERNLSYATITSPIDGVVISRDVEAGQTVASGFETPTLFTIAADLTQMQVVAPETDTRVRVVQVCKSQILVRRDLAAQPDKGLLGHLHQPPGLHAGSGGGVEAALRADERIDQQRVELVFCGPLLHLPAVFAGVEQPVGLPGEGRQSRQEHCRDADQHHQSAQQSEQRFQAQHPSPMRASQSSFAAFASASRVEVLGRM